jgi:hypothetical protein
MTDSGEQPIWASHASLQRMGREDARQHFSYNSRCVLANPTYAAAYNQEWERLERQRDTPGDRYRSNYLS